MNYYQESSTVASQYDMGLRKFMLDVFGNMSLGLAISGLISFFIGNSPQLMMMLFGGPQAFIFMFAPLILVFFLGFKINDIEVNTARMLFFLYSSLMGVSLSTIFILFKLGSIINVFFISAATFGTMALYGYTTKKDLSGMASFLMMGVIGLVIAGLVNIFLQSSALQFAISAFAVLIFVGLTAWDVQDLKNTYYSYDGDEREKMGVIGALNLYMDFINIFINLLQLIGDKKD